MHSAFPKCKGKQSLTLGRRHGPEKGAAVSGIDLEGFTQTKIFLTFSILLTWRNKLEITSCLVGGDDIFVFYGGSLAK